MYRIGFGHDTHVLVSGDSLRLGGVTISHEKQLAGFSDADVLVHAIIDAILGALCCEDIGEMFPNTSEINRGRDSLEMLAGVRDDLASRGYKIVNLDSTIFAERPKISPYKNAMRGKIAEVLHVSLDCVNVKGKTGEKVGIIGREEAISAACAVLLMKIKE